MYNITRADTADTLFDVKLALTSFDVRKKSGNVDETDVVLTRDFVEKASFRLWTGAKHPEHGTAGNHFMS